MMTENRQLLVQDGSRHAEPDGQLAGDGWSIRWQTLRGGLSEGVLTITLTNGLTSVTVCPTRGMGVLNAQHEAVTVGWQSPVVDPVHPHFVNLQSRNGLGWLDGFNEHLCRCGLSFNGPPEIDAGARSPIESEVTLHGRIANTPAHFVEVGFDDNAGKVWVTGECRESTLFGPNLSLISMVSIGNGEPSFHIADTVANHASTPTEMELLYHINIGRPFLEGGARFQTAFREMSPRDARAAEGVDTYAEYLEPTPGYAEQVYFFDTLAEDDNLASALVVNKAGDLGLSVTYDRSQLPCLSQWKCTQPELDGYVTGLEPGTNFPNVKSFERQQGRVISLAPGAVHQTSLTIAVHPSAETVQSVSDKIARRQGDVQSTIHSSPTQPYAVQ